jgi:malate dehydrogenase (oxaloacetate-decarboxylating)(NADP+)
MPNLDAANISFNLLKAAADGLPVGPLLLGMSRPIHVVVPSVTARGIVNISAIASNEAQALRDGTPPIRPASVLTHAAVSLVER